MPELTLHGFFRSSASWRVRIALGLKGLAFSNVSHHLRDGDQSAPDYLAINPQGLVPALVVDGEVLTQSLAICEYLDELHPEPAFLPVDPLGRARVRAFALAIACEIHPLQNLGILNRLKANELSQERVDSWARAVIEKGLLACEALIGNQTGPYCFGAQVTLADVCLIPQLGNARRFGAAIPQRLLDIEAACGALPAFSAARPERQPDAE